MARPSARHWWVTASEKNVPPGTWSHFFNNPRDPVQHLNWGGPQWINSAVSFARIREMRAGDVVVAYQAGIGIVGAAYLASDGYQSITRGQYDTFDLQPAPIVYLHEPVPLALLRQWSPARQHIEFLRIMRGSAFSLTPLGFAHLVTLMRALNPEQARTIEKFLAFRQRTHGR